MFYGNYKKNIVNVEKKRLVLKLYAGVCEAWGRGGGGQLERNFVTIIILNSE